MRHSYWQLGVRLRRAAWFALLATLAACAPRPEQPAREWKILGPGGGGAQFHPTVSPHDPRHVLVGCDMTGSYISHDAGASWRMFNLRSPARAFVFDPVEPNTIYVIARGLWRSTDLGETWNLVYPDPANVTGLVMIGDHATPRFVLREGSYGQVRALAVDPGDSNVLYAAIEEEGAVHLYVSDDRGATWRMDEALDAGVRRIYVDPRSPAGGRTLYVLGEGGVAVREGGRWRRGEMPRDAERFADIALGFTAEGGPVIYAVSESAPYVSTDAGMSWTRRPFPGQGARLQAVGVSLNHPDAVYVSYRNLEAEGRRYLGVARSADRGATWELVWKDSRDAPAENVHGGWLREGFGPLWGGNPFTLGVGPHDPNICYGTDFGRTMKTTDGGRTWYAMYSKRQPDGSWISTGLDVTTCYGVHFDPFDPDHMFITYTDIGLFSSENRGRSWRSATIGVPRRWRNTTYWIVFDPEVKGKAWAVVSGTHDLPRPKMWRNRSPQTFTGGVVVTEDGARTWKVSNEGMPETAATHILLDPESPKERRTLYVAGFGRGVYKSVDGGKTWTLENNGIRGEEPFAWRFARDRDGVIYLIVARRSDDGSIGNEYDGALYRTTDGAETWTPVNLPEGVNGPNGLAIDPEDPKRLYLAAWGRNTPGGATGGGIFVSTDAGATWRNVLSKDQHVYDVTIDPRNPEILYATGFTSSAWRSTDRGETWTRIPGFNFKWGHRVIPDPQDPDMVYITTFGGSLWYGPAEGTPGAVEDIVTPQAAYGR